MHPIGPEIKITLRRPGIQSAYLVNLQLTAWQYLLKKNTVICLFYLPSFFIFSPDN